MTLGGGTIPNLAFEPTFRNALKREAQKQKHLKVSAEDGSVVEAPITVYIVGKVILRDVIVSPFFQGIAFTSFLIIVKPWLQLCVRSGRSLGRKLIDILTGRNLLAGKSSSRI